MSKIWMPGGGGGGDGSDDCTLTLADVPQGLTAVTADSDDDAKAGTLDAAASAADSQVLAGESYMKFNQEAKHWEKRQGGLKNNGAVNLTLNCGESQQIPGGFTTGGTVRANSLASQTPATAGAPQILTGQSAWVNGNRVDGTMPNRGGYWGFGNNKGVDAGNQRMWVQVPGGYYDENAQVFLSWADIRNLTGLTPDKIRKGVPIMGITGSFQGYVDSPLYLYNRGVWNGLQTPGFTAGRSGSDHWRLSGSAVAYTIQTVSLAPYKYITISLQSAGGEGDTDEGFLCISASNNANSSPITSIDFKLVGGSGDCSVTLDITDYNDFYYIGYKSCRTSIGLSFLYYLQLRNV